MQLQNQLEAKQALQLEIEQLKGKINVMKHVGHRGGMEVMKKMEEMHKELQQKEDELADVESLNQTLVVKERMTNEELQEARKALIDVSFKHFTEFCTCCSCYIPLVQT